MDGELEDGGGVRVAAVLLHRRVPMIDLYQGDIRRLSDADLERLQEEIEQAGILSLDECDRDQWEQQAGDRYWQIETELRRRWELAHPQEAIRERQRYESLVKIITANIEAIQPRLGKMFFTNLAFNTPAAISAKDFRIPLHHLNA